MNEILDESKGFIQNDSIVLEVHVIAEAPHGVYWDSKKHTGYVGLKNQGATCYMNSLLQTLYFTNQLRKAVYKMPTEADDSAKSVALALQRVFHELQSSDKPVGTKKLTKSFGWETLDSFMQHDVQEFLRVLLDKIENKMKGTSVEGTVPRLFEGKMTSYIQCKKVTYTSSRNETFYDIQLNIKGKKDIYESFKDYIATELLDGDNKYDAGNFGLQEAEKGVKFVAFPPVLHLHLMRFQYDPITDNSVKFNDRFEFYDKIDLDQFLDQKQETTARYTLHAVLVHSGDNHGGHYVVFINPNGDGKWCKFDDDVVSRCTKEEAIEQNYGGDEYELNIKHSSNAYMLVYIRDSELPNVLQKVAEEDIPTELQEKLQEEKRLEVFRRRERNDSSAYITVNVLLEDYLESHQTTDLLDYERANYRAFRVKRQQTIAELMGMFVDAFNTPIEKMRVWPITQRNSFFAKRPRAFDHVDERARLVQDVSENVNPWIVFLEMLPPDSELEALPIFDRELEILLFFKYYDSREKHLIYCGFGYFNLLAKISTLVPELLRRAGLETGTELTMYEESGPHKVEKFHDFNDTLQKIFNKRNDCAIIIFEKASSCNNNVNSLNNKESIDANFELPTVDLYFKDILSCFEVTFIDKTIPNEPG
jgi:ubiquitin carboxyl-terminal hydrolase 7